ncbi:MAG: winged helix-turn-helix transcriptional regulator [Ignavibacteriae bacterium]|nr:MarR family transcriptional regulator [Ignavibacteriota bacterium]NOG99737.1 winged helix-turn-helix transcriptional regulator [Ignavibacteriota bacterium]
MNNSVFNTELQQQNISSKIVVGLERISEAFKSLIWQIAKTINLSPIQIQIMIFIAYHKKELCNVSYLAKEFNVTKPTISDAVKVLENKNLITKKYSKKDSRSFSIILSAKGKKAVDKISGFANPIKDEVEKISSEELLQLYNSLNQLIHRLNKAGILSVQRICYTCNFYEKNKDNHFCKLLNLKLSEKDIRIDCPDFEELELAE